MKTSLALVVSSLGLAALVSNVAFAQDEKMPKDHPCQKIVAACKAAVDGSGKPLYPQGGHKKDGSGKGLWMDCVKPLKEGQSVPGVTVDPKEVDACKEHKEKRAERKAERAAKEAAAPVSAPAAK